MPGFVKTPKDEKKWSAAKKAAGKSTTVGSDSYYRLANYIYHKSEGNPESEQLASKIRSSMVKSEAGFTEPSYGTVIGKTKSGKPIHYDHLHNESKLKYTPEDHADAAELHTSLKAHHQSQVKKLAYDDPSVKHHLATSDQHDRAAYQHRFPNSELRMGKSEEMSKAMNPMKVGQLNGMRLPKAKKMPDPFGKKSLLLKQEDSIGPKHASVRKLRDFLHNRQAKKKPGSNL